MYKIILPGKPIPWKRMGISGKRVFDRQARDREVTKLQMRQQILRKPLLCKIRLFVSFYFKPAKSHSKRHQERLVNDIYYHDQKPDLDNLTKWILDCGNGILWDDDKQICNIEAGKYWDKEDSTELTIHEI